MNKPTEKSQIILIFHSFSSKTSENRKTQGKNYVVWDIS